MTKAEMLFEMRDNGWVPAVDVHDSYEDIKVQTIQICIQTVMMMEKIRNTAESALKEQRVSVVFLELMCFSSSSSEGGEICVIEILLFKSYCKRSVSVGQSVSMQTQICDIETLPRRFCFAGMFS